LCIAISGLDINQAENITVFGDGFFYFLRLALQKNKSLENECTSSVIVTFG
jgi:hypothetical protein